MRLDEFTDVHYVVDEQCAVITIDRPDRMNAHSEEGMEGAQAFIERREPDFSRFRAGP